MDHTHAAHTTAGPKVTDPVCGMAVDPATSRFRVTHGTATYHFCSASCNEKFEKEPERYLKEAPKPADSGREYTCPMHPEVSQIGPGACPLCGMALEPRVASLSEDDDNAELEDMQRRFYVCLVLTVPVLFSAMIHMFPVHLLSGPVRLFVEFAFTTPVVLWGAWPFFVRGWASIRNRSFNMFTLIAMGVGTAFGFSVAATLFPGWFPSSFQLRDGTMPVYFEAAAVIVRRCK